MSDQDFFDDLEEQEERNAPHCVPNVFVKHETEKALLCRITGKDAWIPKSQILDESEVQSDGDEGTLIIPYWLAEKVVF